MNNISEQDIELISRAKHVLETESIAMRVSRMAGKPVEKLAQYIPDELQAAITGGVNASLEKALAWVMATTGSYEEPFCRADWMHTVSVWATGAAGGFGGISSTIAELPVSTMLMLRSIGSIAEAEGIDLSDPCARAACVSILGMGSVSNKQAGDELGYWSARKAVGTLVTDAVRWSGKGAPPALCKFVTKVGERFGVKISSKIAAQAAPVVGALAGITINHVFMDHCQKVAHAYFGLERLCNYYGEAAVREVYEAIELPAARPRKKIIHQVIPHLRLPGLNLG